MELESFVVERRDRWRRLESLLLDVERLEDHEVGPARLEELVRLYRQVCSDLNQARALTANADLLGRLNGLAGRGYRFIYRRQHGRLYAEAVKRFFRYEAADTFRRERGVVLAAALSFLLGALFGFGAVVIDRDNGERLIPAEFFTASPRARVERIEAGKERIDSIEEAAAFGAHLFSHNIRVSFLAFALGAVTIVGGIWMLFYNGVLLGAIAAMYLLDGVSVFFMAWIGPHGALELPAVVFAAATGLRAGRALLLPGDLSSGCAIRRAFPSLWRMLIMTILLLVAAGLIEGSFSQFSAKTVPYAIKIGVTVALFVSMLTYLFLRPLRSSALSRRRVRFRRRRLREKAA